MRSCHSHRAFPMGQPLTLIEIATPTGAGAVEVPVERVAGEERWEEGDFLAVEEPLEIRLGWEQNGRRTQRTVSVTMRTPGEDFELAAGFLVSEGIVRSPDQVERLGRCPGARGAGRENIVRVDLRADASVDWGRLERHFYTASSCGVCGKTSIQAVHVESRHPLQASWPVVSPGVIERLPETLRRTQQVFERTGGLHAAALFDTEGKLLRMREDVGRHNALDKLIGAQFLAGQLPLSACLLLVSGRASFELVQKALVAGIPILAAVGAPSSLAVDLARDAGMTVLGFVRPGRFNIYSGAERIAPAGAGAEGPRRSATNPQSGEPDVSVLLSAVRPEEPSPAAVQPAQP